MPRTRSDERVDTSGSNILVKRDSIRLDPLDGPYSPSELLERWEREGLLKMTPGFRHRILAPPHSSDVPEKLHLSVSELAEAAEENRYMRWLPPRRESLRLIHLTEVLKQIVGDRSEGLLEAKVLQFPFGLSDIVSFKRRSSTPFLDASASDRKKEWPAGTFVLCRLPL